MHSNRQRIRLRSFHLQWWAGGQGAWVLLLADTQTDAHTCTHTRPNVLWLAVCRSPFLVASILSEVGSKNINWEGGWGECPWRVREEADDLGQWLWQVGGVDGPEECGMVASVWPHLRSVVVGLKWDHQQVVFSPANLAAAYRLRLGRELDLTLVWGFAKWVWWRKMV